MADVRTNANAARWYLAPGHAIAGAVNVGKSGRVQQFTQGRARAEQGTATTGVLNYGLANGVNPFSFQGVINNNIYSEIDQRVSQRRGFCDQALRVQSWCACCAPPPHSVLLILPA